MLSLHYHRIQFLTCVANGDWEVIAKVFPSIRPDNMNELRRQRWKRENLNELNFKIVPRSQHLNLPWAEHNFFIWFTKWKVCCHPETTHIYGFLDMYFAWKAFFFTGREKSCAERIVQHPRVINGEKKCKNTKQVGGTRTLLTSRRLVSFFNSFIAERIERI